MNKYLELPPTSEISEFTDIATKIMGSPGAAALVTHVNDKYYYWDVNGIMNMY